MAFHDDPWLAVQALIDGSWEDLVTDFDDNDGGSRVSGKGVTISRGKSVGAQRANTSECDFTVFSRDGKYSNRNPRSPYFGLLPLNTPVRVVTTPYESHLKIESNQNNPPYVYAADTAALDITGDMEIRIDMELEHSAERSHAYVLISKYNQSANRSWLLYMNTGSGRPAFYWTTDGSASTLRVHNATAGIPGGRITLRVQMDVNNGASGATTRFYTGPTIDGPWTQLGSDVTSSPTTSIFSGNANVTVGMGSSGIGIAGSTTEPFRGKLYGVRFYNNLTGTLTAEGDFTELEYGDTAYTDGVINWTIGSPAYVASDSVRFYGFVPRWPIEQDTTGNHVYSDIKAYGKWQVLNNGAKALDSPMRRYYGSLTANKGYWPCEDLEGAVRLASAVSGVAPARYSNIDLAQNDTLPGSAALMNIDSDSFAVGLFPVHDASGAIAFTFAMYMSAQPAVDCNIISFTTTTGIRGEFRHGTGVYTSNFYNQNGTLVSTNSTSYGTGAEPGQWLVMVYELEQSGSDVTWTLNWRTTDPNIGYAHGGTVTSATLGALKLWYIPGLSTGHGVDTASLGHIAGSTSVDDYLENAHITSFRGYVGETEMNRLLRLADEFGFEMIIRGNADRGVPMGAQGQKTLVSLLDECADSGLGVLYEARWTDAFVYLSRSEIENYSCVDLAHTDVLTAGKVDDDLVPANSVTVTRDGGSSYTADTTYGPKKISQIGLYEDPRTLNLYVDEQTQHFANWIRVLGSWDELRWETLGLNLARPIIADDPALLNSVKGLDIGSAVRVTGMPDYLPIRESEGFIENYTEVLNRHEFTLTLETTPIAPYQVAELNHESIVIGSSTSVLETAVSSTSATTISVECNDDMCTWAYTADFDIAVGTELSPEKERMTVTGISGSTSPYTFTVTRGTPANTHVVGSTVRLWEQRRIAF